MDANRFLDASALTKELDGYVLGQEEGVRRVAMAVTSHLLRIRSRRQDKNSCIRKDNMLLAGPSGCGKTETFRVLQRLEDELGFPVIMRNAMDYAPSDSWKGQALTCVLRDLFDEARKMYARKYGEGPVCSYRNEQICRLASNGIILLDEFDKLNVRDDNTEGFCRDYQSCLLKMVEGAEYKLGEMTVGTPFDDDDDAETLTIKVDTSEVMFIFLGAFDGLENVTRRRLRAEQARKDEQAAGTEEAGSHIGFLAKIGPGKPEPGKKLPADADLTPSLDDIVEFGFKRELAGRLAIRALYKPLTEESFVKIMKDSKTSSYLDYQARFKAMGHRLACDEDAFREIARIAVGRKTGARGLANIFSELLSPTMYDLSGRHDPVECILRGSDVRKRRRPLLRPLRGNGGRSFRFGRRRG